MIFVPNQLLISLELLQEELVNLTGKNEQLQQQLDELKDIRTQFEDTKRR
jgi:hypothetical protein